MSIAFVLPVLITLAIGAWMGWTRGGITTRTRKVGELVATLLFLGAFLMMSGRRSDHSSHYFGVYLLSSVCAILLLLAEHGSRRLRRYRDRAWCRNVANTLELDAPEGAGDRAPSGKIDGISVSLEGTSGKTLLILSNLYAPVTLTLVERAPARFDPERARFEDLYQTGGTELERLLVYDAASRRRLLELARDPRLQRLEVRGETLVAELAGQDPQEVATLVREVVSSLRFLFRPVDEAARLMGILEEETSTSARILALSRLVARRETRKQLRRAFEIASASEDPALRALAAYWHLDAAALEAAERDGGLQIQEVIDAMSQIAFPELDRARLRAVGLVLVRARAEAAWVQGAALLARSCTGPDEEVERALLARASSKDPRLQTALAELLGVVGGAPSVATLMQLSEALRADVRGAATSALRSVRARLVGAEAGTIRLADDAPEQGAIRVAEGSEGAIRVAEEPPRRPTPQALKG